MKKYNLLINNSFKTFDFNDLIDDSIYSKNNSNLTKYSAIITLSNKPSDNTTYVTLNLNGTISCLIFPINNENYTFGVGDILYSFDNIATFVILSHVSSNTFTLRLINLTSGSSYNLTNTTPCLLYNQNFENYIYSINSMKDYISASKTEYTAFINNNNDFVTYILENINISYSDNTTVINFSFTDSSTTLVSKIINKFYLNIQIFDYNSFKYIYMNDIKNQLSKSNQQFSSTKIISGSLKSLSTKVIPHFSSKLLTSNTYNFSSTIINDKTKFRKTYDNDKLLILLQLTLNDKSIIYDQLNNVESDYIYIIH